MVKNSIKIPKDVIISINKENDIFKVLIKGR